VAPRLLEDNYNVADAVVVGNLLISLLRHTDRVHAASLAQLVNVIAPIFTQPGGGIFKQTTFHPFALTSRYAKGDVLRLAIDAETVDTKEFGTVPLLDAVATYDSDSGDLVVFAVNRNIADELTLTTALHGFGDLKVVEAVSMYSADPYVKASFADDTSMAPKPNDTAAVADGALTAVLPPVSWSMIRLAKA
jgi:alpha-N-arabinofuranosidase